MKIARGHLERVIKMVESDDYCIDVVHQSLAVQKALRESDKLLLASHLRTCVPDSIKKGNTNNVLTEVMKVVDKL